MEESLEKVAVFRDAPTGNAFTYMIKVVRVVEVQSVVQEKVRSANTTASYVLVHVFLQVRQIVLHETRNLHLYVRFAKGTREVFDVVLFREVYKETHEPLLDTPLLLPHVARRFNLVGFVQHVQLYSIKVRYLFRVQHFLQSLV